MNPLVHISCLPLEILTDIFILCARNNHYYQTWIPDPSVRSVPNWVNISYVCRDWREAAINCPTLWSYIFVISQRWTEELLARSNQASLKILANFWHASPLFSHLLEQVAPHVERVEELCVTFPGIDSDSQLLSEVLSAPAPRLQVLKISNFVATADLPLLLFQGKTPALRKLSLSYCSVAVPLRSFVLSSLTSLSLTHFPLPELRLDIGELLDALRRMPSLERLDLEDALTCARHFLSDDTVNTAPKINLSRLSYLFITAPLSAIVALLSFVTIPLKAELFLFQSTGVPIATQDEYNQFLHLLVQRFNPDQGDLALAAPTFRSLVIRNDAQARGLVQVVCRISEKIPYDFEGWETYFPLSIVLNTERLPPLNMISDICRSVPLTNVRNIFFNRLPRSSGFWQEVRQLPVDVRAWRMVGLDSEDEDDRSLCTDSEYDSESAPSDSSDSE